MVFAVQCPNPKCRKYMLVEDRDLNHVVPCLLCKTAIKVGSPPAPSPQAPRAGSGPPTPPPVRRP
jgi:hypothetical protein